MESAWVLRSPHEDGLHLVVRSERGTHETLARLVDWQSAAVAAAAEPDSPVRSPSDGPHAPTPCVEAADPMLLPMDTRAISWCGWDASAPVRLAACSAKDVHIIDLAYNNFPRRFRASYTPESSGALGAGVAWAGGGAAIVFASGSLLHAIDAETGMSVCSQPAPMPMPMDTCLTVASIAMAGPSVVVAGWESSSQNFGCVHLLDLRMQAPSRHPTIIASGAVGVHGLCCSPPEPHLAASCSRAPAPSAAFVWDIRHPSALAAQPISQLRGGGEPMALQGTAGLEWSPAKRGTLLALSAFDGDGGGSALVCRLSPMYEGDASQCQWLGDCRAMADASGADGGRLLAASWAHASRPGAALAVRSGGALAVLEQRVPRLASWNPRGGAVVVRPWPSAAAAASAPRRGPGGSLLAATAEGTAGLASASCGAAPVIEAPPAMASADAAYLIRERAELFEYGLSKGMCDDFSRLVRGLGARSVPTEALAATWQWVKSADAGGDFEEEDQEPSQEHACWRGVRTFLSAGEDAAAAAGIDASTEVAKGVRVYTSERRRRALRSLGLAEPARRAEQAEGEGTELQAEEVVRRLLSAVVSLHFDRAAGDCQLLESSCGPQGRAILTHMACMLQGAAYNLLGSDARASPAAPPARTPPAIGLQRRSSRMTGMTPTPTSEVAGDERGEDDHAPPARAAADDPRDPCRPFRATLRGLLTSPAWHELPAAASLSLALRVVESVVAAARSSDAPTVEDSVQGLLCWQPGARPSVAFRCALALQFLPQARLEPAIDAMITECMRGGYLDGLCLTGLGGAGDPYPYQGTSVEDLVLDIGAPPPAVALASATQPLATPPAAALASATPAAAPDLARSASEQNLAAKAVPFDDGSNLVWSHVVRTGDVQSAALLFCYAANLQRPPRALQRCFTQYVGLLSRWRLDRQRMDLQEQLSARLPPPPGSEWQSVQRSGPDVYCTFCSGKLMSGGRTDIDAILRRCPNASCSKATSSCAVCLLPILMVRSRSEESDASDKEPVRLAMDSWVAWCQNCHHGGHMAHLEEWFGAHIECPVAGCSCQCGSIY